MKHFRRGGCRFFDILEMCWTGNVRIPIYFACKAESDIYLAFQTVASTWASKLQGKFIDSRSKKRASDIPELFVPFDFLDFTMTQRQEAEIGAVK